MQDARQVAGQLHKARRLIGTSLTAVQQVNGLSADVRALEEAYRLLGLVMDRIYPREGR